MFLPSAEDITKMATDAIAKFINNSGKQEVIAKYGTMADEFTKVQGKITSWIRDGQLDDAEKDELYRALLPLAEKLVEEVKK